MTAQLAEHMQAQPHADRQVGMSPVAEETERQSAAEKHTDAEAQAETPGHTAATAQAGGPALHPTPTGKPQLSSSLLQCR